MDANRDQFGKNIKEGTLGTNNDNKFELRINCYDFPVESNQSERLEAMKCIEKAQTAVSEAQYDKAERFLLKSLRICASEKAKTYLEDVRNAKTKNNIVNNCHNEEMNEYIKYRKLATQAFAEGNLANTERFLLKAIGINPSNDARKQLKHIQDLITAQASELEKQQSEETTEQMNQLNLKTRGELDKVNNPTPYDDLENISEIANECIEKAQSAFNEGNCDRALRLLIKAERMYPTERAKHMMKQVNEKLLQNGVNPNEVPKKVDKNIVRKDNNVSSPQPNKKEVPNTYITEIQRVKNAKDDYGVLGIPKGATLEEVDKAYKHLTKILHPDKNKAPGAEEAFMKVKDAKNRLKPRRR